MVEAQLPGREYDKATIQYITELMREAHKRKVPIILGPEATATFHNLNMEKKLPKAWLGRLVVDSDQNIFSWRPNELKIKEGVLFSVSGAQEREHGARIADWGRMLLVSLRLDGQRLSLLVALLSLMQKNGLGELVMVSNYNIKIKARCKACYI